MNECGTVEPLLPVFLDGELGRPDAARVASHLVECRRCLEDARGLVESWRLFRDAHPDQPLPASLLRPREVESSGPPLPRPWTWAASFAGAAALAVWLGVRSAPRPGSDEPPRLAAAPVFEGSGPGLPAAPRPGGARPELPAAPVAKGRGPGLAAPPLEGSDRALLPAPPLPVKS